MEGKARLAAEEERLADPNRPTRFIRASREGNRRCGVAHTARYRNRSAGDGTARLPRLRGFWPDCLDGELRVPWSIPGVLPRDERKQAEDAPALLSAMHSARRPHSGATSSQPPVAGSLRSRFPRGLLHRLLHRSFRHRLVRRLLDGALYRLLSCRPRDRNPLHGAFRRPPHGSDRAPHRALDRLDGIVRRLPDLLLDGTLCGLVLGFRRVAQVGSVRALVGLDVLELAALVTDGVELRPGSASHGGTTDGHVSPWHRILRRTSACSMYTTHSSCSLTTVNILCSLANYSFMA